MITNRNVRLITNNKLNVHAGTTKVRLYRHTQVPEPGPAENTGTVTRSGVGVVCESAMGEHITGEDSGGCSELFAV